MASLIWVPLPSLSHSTQQHLASETHQQFGRRRERLRTPRPYTRTNVAQSPSSDLRIFYRLVQEKQKNAPLQHRAI